MPLLISPSPRILQITSMYSLVNSALLGWDPFFSLWLKPHLEWIDICICLIRKTHNTLAIPLLFWNPCIYLFLLYFIFSTYGRKHVILTFLLLSYHNISPNHIHFSHFSSKNRILLSCYWIKLHYLCFYVLFSLSIHMLSNMGLFHSWTL